MLCCPIVNIWTATPNDQHKLAALQQERAVLIQQANPRATAASQDLQAVLHDPTYVIVLAAQDDHPTGYIIGQVLDDETALVHEMALDAHTYHAGLGRTLWQQLAATFTDRQVYIRVPRYFPVEQAFWRSLGARHTEWKAAPQEFMWMTL